MQWGLIKLRKERGITQEQLAKIIGINTRTYVTKELSQREFKLSEMIKIHQHFGNSLDEIFLPPECIKNAEVE